VIVIIRDAMMRDVVTEDTMIAAMSNGIHTDKMRASEATATKVVATDGIVTIKAIEEIEMIVVRGAIGTRTMTGLVVVFI
jgi:hypothetical protein